MTHDTLADFKYKLSKPREIIQQNTYIQETINHNKSQPELVNVDVKK